MLRRLLRFIVYILVIEMICFVAMGAWIVYDGTHDRFDATDAALVPGYSEIKDGLLSPALTARLDRAAALFNDEKCTFIIVSGVTPPGEDDESEAMDRYLQAHSVPANNIIQDHPGEKDKANDSVDSLVKIMKAQDMHSLTLISDYYRLVHLKLRLAHAGENQLAQVHLGEWEWKKENLINVMNEDIAIYRDMYYWYVLPDSKIAGTKALEEAETIKGSINSEIQSLRK